MTRNALALLLATALLSVQAADTTGKKIYECRFMQNAPYGVSAWVQSTAVSTGKGKENRFVPYNSDAAQGLWLDATTTRDVDAATGAEGRETSFYMVYDAKGWYTYIECVEPELEGLIERGKDVSIELFFCPGLENVPYYQMIIRQLAGTVQHYDWGMPHRRYRPVKDAVIVESMQIDGGVATFLFVPWDVLYDRVPAGDAHWRFSFMRWGGTPMTWGGKVHDTGNFGLVHFQKPTAEQLAEIQKNILRAAKLKFGKTTRELETFWGDEEMGDPEYFENVLSPAIGRARTLDPSNAPEEAIALWMEFQYDASDLRREYLLNKHLP